MFLTGEIIHNPHVNDRLRRKGIRFLTDPSDEPALGPQDVVVLPAFGANAGAKAVGLYDERNEKPDVKVISTNQHTAECLVYDWKATESKYGLHDDAKVEA